jgi:uncharacterized protein YjeT (DUF2065 family)
MFAHQELDSRQLRYFGASLVALIAIFSMLAYWKWEQTWIAVALAVFAVILGLFYYLIPSTQRKIYNRFRTIVSPIQIVVTAILLAVVYYGVLTPIGLLIRVAGISVRSSPNDSSSTQSGTYWANRPDTPPPSRYFDTY